MRNEIRRLPIDRESPTEEFIRELLLGVAEGIGAACIAVALLLVFWGSK